MKAVVLREHGGPSALELVDDYPDPTPGTGEVIVRVRATSLNYHDVFTRRGMPGITLKLPIILGLDVAGEIAVVGPGVEGWRVGERVLVDPLDRLSWGLIGETLDGGMAELCRAGAHQLVRLPDGVSFEDAAALPVAYGTALRMLNRGCVKLGDRVLILGASGGVGTSCLLLAKMMGAEVIACASSASKAKQLEAFGADRVIDTSVEDFETVIKTVYGKPHRRTYTGGVDVVVNFTGGETFVKSLRCLRRGGRLLTCGATAGFDPKADLRYMWSFELSMMGSNGWQPSDLEILLDHVAKGSIKPIVHKVLPLSEVREGLRLLEDREVIGKVVIVPHLPKRTTNAAAPSERRLETSA